MNLGMPGRENPFGELLKKIEKKVKKAKVSIKGRALADKILADYFKDKAGYVSASSVRNGVVMLDVTASAMFQEIEGFHKEKLLFAFRDGGMKVSEVRARMKSF